MHYRYLSHAPPVSGQNVFSQKDAFFLFSNTASGRENKTKEREREGERERDVYRQSRSD
jgi:hypothetical protein